MSEQIPIQPAAKTRKLISTILGGILLLIVVAFIFMMLMGPITGNVFSTINGNLSRADGVYGASGDHALLLPAEEAPKITDRLIIRNGSLTLTVKDTLATQKDIEKMVSELAGEGAFVVSSEAHVSTEGEMPYVNMEIRTPAIKFDETMDRIASMGVEVNSRTESAQDVTADYVDLKTRLEALEAARDRLLQIMKESATTDDLLQAEQQLTQREAEIESLKGQMQYLSESARLSSITISLQPYILNQPLDTRWRPAETVRHAFEALVNGLRGFTDFLIVFVIAILPWLLLFGGIWYGVRRVVGKRRAKKQQAMAKE
jgi:hypothetical protein